MSGTKIQSDKAQILTELSDSDNKTLANIKKQTTSPNHDSKSKGGRPQKAILYAKERQIVLNKLLTILGVTEENMLIDVDLLESDKNKQADIIALNEDVQKFFSGGPSRYQTRKDIKKPYLSQVKSILKQMNYTFEYKYVIHGNNRKNQKKYIEIIKQ